MRKTTINLFFLLIIPFLALGLPNAATAVTLDIFTVLNRDLDSTDIRTVIRNQDGQPLDSILFDLSTTTSNAPGNPPLVIDGSPFDVYAAQVDSYSFFSSGGSFGFNFTGFNDGDVFRFSWDPDISTDPLYGAVNEELDGALITVYTTFGSSSGTMQTRAFTDRVIARIPSPDTAPVPEPSTILLMGAGLLGLVAVGRRKFNRKE